MSPEIQNTPIKGTLTIKQVAAYTAAVGALIALYFNIVGRISDAKRVSDENNKILQEIRADRKEEARMNNIRITDIENRQRMDNLRITVLEVKMKEEK